MCTSIKNLWVLKFSIVFTFLGIIPAFLVAQQETGLITGKVYELIDGENIPLTGANVFWANTTTGTVTNGNGEFTLEKIAKAKLLVASFVGYEPDTLNIEENPDVQFILKNSLQIRQVEVVRRAKTVEFSMLEPIKVEKIGEGELKKAACCNLSESFETNPSVDVSFTDAITGTKQIQMLGLSGPYTQITSENMPDIRGLSAVYGMEYIPGHWIESIQLNKGTGSVVNGFESIAGQINVELRKPETADRLYFNLYGNNESRVEGNLNLKHELSGHVATALLLHARTQHVSMDDNNDGFIDKPVGEQFIVLNRWDMHNDKGWESRLGIKATHVDNFGGQKGYVPEGNNGLWGMQMNTQRYEAWLKLGKVSAKKDYQSFGTQYSGIFHKHDAVFGRKTYSAQQKSGYFNFIFQSAIGDTRYKYRSGTSLQYDQLSETLDSIGFIREEMVPGIFYEFTYSPVPQFDAVAGLRADWHNSYGLFFIPRLHIRYAPFEKSVLRFSAGKGLRTASIMAENTSVLASARQVVVLGSENGKPYGLDAEKAWNFGANFTQKFRLDYRDGAVSFDLYHTLFENQVVVDLDENPQQVHFYNLNGTSYSTSFQSQIDYELFRRFDIRLAYRWYDVKTSYFSGIQDKPLISKNRSFVNIAYATRKYWKFDFTTQWYGSKRIPSTATNPEKYQIGEASPSFFQMNAQISKEWNEKFEVYIGAENLLNYKQQNPIIAFDEPFGPYFDSSLIWGPVSGRMFYGGLRLKMN
ncbi:MAG: TonB-dependent receptor [Bacteroidales bacterium]|nr:TonB-dependent receptor [Bacteroidales bacterium]